MFIYCMYMQHAARLVAVAGGLFSLHVPGLSENRPSVLRGDAVEAIPLWGTPHIIFARARECSFSLHPPPPHALSPLPLLRADLLHSTI